MLTSFFIWFLSTGKTEKEREERDKRKEEGRKEGRKIDINTFFL